MITFIVNSIRMFPFHSHNLLFNVHSLAGTYAINKCY